VNRFEDNKYKEPISRTVWLKSNPRIGTEEVWWPASWNGHWSWPIVLSIGA